MSDLGAFLRSRLDADEQLARFRQAHPTSYTTPTQGFVDFGDPARVLRDVAAKRAILELHATGRATEPRQCVTCHENEPCLTLRLLAAVYTNHPGYDPRWSPHAPA